MADVLVVGAGPVGLTMAAELARHGARCRIVDKLAAPSGYCKAIGVTPRTLEVWEDMGVARAMIEHGIWLRGLRTIVAGKTHETLLDFPDLPYGNLGIPQYATERILAEHLARQGVSVERGLELASLRDDGRRVTVELKGPNGRTESAEFRYVVGCDGAHSAVRHALDIGFPGDRFPMEFMLGDVAIDWDVPRGLGVFAIVPRENDAPDFLVVIPQPERNRYRISMLASEEPAEAGGEEHGIMSERPGPVARANAGGGRPARCPARRACRTLRWSSLFRISMRLADKYRVGNAFIAGDAAHIHPPTGGQGMNTGIQDAYNLAWKMALVLRGAADARLLDSYEAERRPVGAEVVERTRQASMSFGRDRGKKDNRLEDTQILVNYRGSAWVREASKSRKKTALQAGDRAPDAHGLRQDQVGFPLRLFEVLRGTAHVLVVLPRRTHGAPAGRRTGGAGARPRLRLSGCGARGGDRSEERESVPEPVGVTLLADGEGAFARAYAAKSGSTFLIRPDGYVGYVADTLDRAELFGFLKRSLR